MSASQPQVKKCVVVTYISNYDHDVKTHIIGNFTNEQKAIDSVIPWLFKNKLGGFEVDWLSEKFEEAIEEELNGVVPPELDFERTKENFIKYYKNKCKTWNDLHQILDEDGDSYFADSPGWNIHWKWSTIQ